MTARAARIGCKTGTTIKGIDINDNIFAAAARSLYGEMAGNLRAAWRRSAEQGGRGAGSGLIRQHGRLFAVGAMLGAAAQADDGPQRKPGEHPAVIAQRLHKTAGYDYALKFYPHPASLYLHAEPPGGAAGVAQAAVANSILPGLSSKSATETIHIAGQFALIGSRPTAPRVGERYLTASNGLCMDCNECNTCQVPQVNAKPVVASLFNGMASARR